jgi:hemerythrin superfamily protein
MRATDLIRSDHEHVKQLFHQFEQTPQQQGDARQRLVDQLADELEVHAKLEEELFYPAVQRVSAEIEHSKEEHKKVRSILGDIQGRDPGSTEFATKVGELKQAVLHHATEEEQKVFADARKLGDSELDRLGTQMEERKQTLKTSLLQRGMRAAKQAGQKLT